VQKFSVVAGSGERRFRESEHVIDAAKDPQRLRHADGELKYLLVPALLVCQSARQ
jgi:hypothetical protein